MKILALESSAVAASCAILSDGKLISEAFLNIGLTHSQTLLPLAQQALTAAKCSIHDMDAFAVAVGPGSFTGIRIGVATVKGLAFTANKPCFSVSTLEAMAASCGIANKIICPVMDARCMQVYTALFRFEIGRLLRLTEDAAIRIEELSSLLKEYGEEVLLLGDGAEKFISVLQENGICCSLAPQSILYQHASGVAAAAYDAHKNGLEPISSEQLVPAYLRLSQAERERENKCKGEQKQ